MVTSNPTTHDVECHIDDAPFIEALGFGFRNAATIRAKMLAAGVPVSLATIRERMFEFTRYGEGIDAKGKAWRITPAEPSPIMVLPAPARDNDNFPEPANDVGEDGHPSPTLGFGLNHGDCLELMKLIPDASVDLVLVDPPYGTCRAKMNGKDIDVPLDLEALWKEYRRIIKTEGNIVIFGSQPFTTDMIVAGRDWYKYSNIWLKGYGTGHPHARNKPMKNYEDIMVFSPSPIGHASKATGSTKNASKHRACFNPWKAREIIKKNNPKRNRNSKYAPNIKAYDGVHDYLGLENCPTMVLEYEKERSRDNLHPFAKPIPLMDDLIRMYSNEGDVVLDHCAGSGSTAVAAIGANRRWIAIEKNDDCHRDAEQRITAVLTMAG